MLTKTKSNRKPTGGKNTANRKAKWYEASGQPTLTKIGERKTKTVRGRGGNIKVKLIESDIVNLINQKTKKALKAKILTVVESPANRHFVRRNILTKGAVVMTDKGKARITSRPGQEGTINAVLVE